MLLYILLLLILLIVFIKNPSKGILLTVITKPTISLFTFGRGYRLDTIMAIVALVYLLINHKKYFYKKSFFPFAFGLIIAFLSYVISGLYNGQDKLPLILIVNCYDYILVLCLWYLYKPSKSNNRFLYATIIIYAFVLTLYGIPEAITGENPFIQYMYKIGMVHSLQRDDYIRFGLYRAQSLTIWMESFGTFCCFALVFLLISAFKGIIKFDIKIYVISILLIASIFITGSRTMMVMTAIAVLSLISFFYKKPKYILLFALIIFIFVANNPDYLEQVEDSFINSSDAGGSSVEMRQYQLLAALSYYYNSPVFGNGIDFIDLVQKQDSDILGAESILFKTLVDRGNLGIITLIILYLNIFYVLIRRKLYTLCFIPLAYMFGKLGTLIWGHSEVYVLFWLIPLMKMLEYKKEIDLGKNKTSNKSYNL